MKYWCSYNTGIDQTAQRKKNDPAAGIIIILGCAC